jgi:hypothetical protein
MKRCLVLCLVAGVSFAAGRVFNGIPSKCTAKNGDVNADGNVDLSDAVTILGHLFLGKPAQLVPFCAPPSVLPDTGQSLCTDANGNAIDCASATCGGQDGFYHTGCPSKDRFTDNGDETVTDTCTGLIWQKDTADVNGDGQVPDNGSDTLTWCNALAYCENLSFARHDDWRLPNVRELQSIVDYGRVGPAIDPVFGALSSGYWSSTSVPGNPDFAWFAGFFFGFVDNVVGEAGRNYVRAVRTAP